MQNAPPFLIAKEFLIFQQTFCYSEIGICKSPAFVHFRHKAYLLPITPQIWVVSSELSLLPENPPSGSFLGASWAPPPLAGCQTVGQSVQKSRIAAASLEKGTSAGLPQAPTYVSGCWVSVSSPHTAEQACPDQEGSVSRGELSYKREERNSLQVC